MKALQRQQETEIAHLKAELARLTHERDQWRHAVLAAYTARLRAQEARLQQLETHVVGAQRLPE
jgi:hypothetical protein